MWGLGSGFGVQGSSACGFGFEAYAWGTDTSWKTWETEKVFRELRSIKTSETPGAQCILFLSKCGKPASRDKLHIMNCEDFTVGSH